MVSKNLVFLNNLDFLHFIQALYLVIYLFILINRWGYLNLNFDKASFDKLRVL